MQKIDHRISYSIVLDCETCPVDCEIDRVCATNMFAYDIGWAIVDKHGNIYEKRSFVVADIFLNEKTLMKSAYYAEKIPQYWEDIKNGTRLLKRWSNIRKTLCEDIATYGITCIYAHNMRFDYAALNNTERWITKSKYRYFFPYSIEPYDTLKMARQVVGTMPTYKKFCEENNYLTKHTRPQVRLTAEILYRFITKDNEFTESHTGLEDVLIETEIMKYCYSRHKKMNGRLFNND